MLRGAIGTKQQRLKKTEEARVQTEIMLAKLKKINTSVYITYKFYRKDKKKDKSNIAAFARKVIEDSLVKMGILKNDGWNDVEGYHDEFYIDKDNPRIEVEIV